jgi:hypothetical protein
MGRGTQQTRSWAYCRAVGTKLTAVDLDGSRSDLRSGSAHCARFDPERAGVVWRRDADCGSNPASVADAALLTSTEGHVSRARVATIDGAVAPLKSVRA